MGRAPELSACYSLGLRGHTSVLGVCVSLLLLRKRLCVCVCVCVESKCRQEYDPVNVCACQQPLSGPLLSLWGASSRQRVKKKKKKSIGRSCFLTLFQSPRPPPRLTSVPGARCLIPPGSVQPNHCTVRTSSFPGPFVRAVAQGGACEPSAPSPEILPSVSVSLPARLELTSADPVAEKVLAAGLP